MLRRTKYILGLALIFLAVNTHAQPNPGDPDAPITGVEYLIGLGAFFGVKRILNSFKKDTRA